MEKQKWLTVGRYALRLSPGKPLAVLTAAASYRQIFWRVYRVGPGLPFNVFVRHTPQPWVLN